jgi:hypothetical protein
VVAVARHKSLRGSNEKKISHGRVSWQPSARSFHQGPFISSIGYFINLANLNRIAMTSSVASAATADTSGIMGESAEAVELGAFSV